MFKSNFRLTAFIEKNGELTIGFSDKKEDSHRAIYQRLCENPLNERDFDIPLYGRFYALLYGNSRRPQLIIYGWSSDYGPDKLDYHQDQYENLIRTFATEHSFDLLFLP